MRFICAAFGAVDYEHEGRRFRVYMVGDESFHWNDGVFEEIKAQLGTIMMSSSSEFPPASICRWFPSYVPARYRDGRFEYQGERPVLRKTPHGWEAAVFRKEQILGEAIGRRWFEIRDWAGQRWGWGSYRYKTVDRAVQERFFDSVTKRLRQGVESDPLLGSGWKANLEEKFQLTAAA